MADNKYKLQFTLSNGETINAGEIVAPQGPKGDKGDSADIPYSSSTPFMDGVGSVGSASTVARGDHRHPSDTSRQEKLVSGENIKTINGQSVLGSGDIPISGGGSEYENTSEIVDGAITLTSTSTLADLATQILAQKTKVCRVTYGANTLDTLARLYELFNVSNASDAPSFTFEYFFKVLSSDDYIELECAGGGSAAFFRGGITRYYQGSTVPPYGEWKAIPLMRYANSYPVGSIYQSTSSTSPSSLFGGTWTALPNEGTNETASLIMTEQAISSSSFSFESGAGTVVADEFFVVHNADYSIMQITGRLKVTPSSTSGGTVGVKFNIGSNIIKKTSQGRQCGVYYDGSGGHESVWIQIKTSGDIVIYNNSTYVNLPTTEAMWSVNAIFFNKSSDGDIMYRWKRIA